MAFPANPSDKTIFEASPDIFYMYDAQTAGWKKLPSSVRLALATPVSDGAMSSEDYLKLLNIKSDPFETTLTSEHCDLTFSSGYLNIGGDDFVDVRTTSNFSNPATGMPNVELSLKVDRNTAIIDITIDPQKLALELLRRNSLSLKGSKGEKGPKGNRGPNGQKVETGPKGPSGLPGRSSCGASVFEDLYDIAGIESSGTAIVDIETKLMTNGKTKVIVYRGAIGDDEIAPSSIDVERSTSTWVIALSGQASDSVITSDLKACTVQSIDGPPSGQKLYYIDIFPIISAIQTKYYLEAERIRSGTADIARAWLEMMDQIYALSKDALCCALYECVKQQTINAEKAAAGEEEEEPSPPPPTPQEFMDREFSPMALSTPTPLTDLRVSITPENPKASVVPQSGLYKINYLKYPVTGSAGHHAEFTIQYRHGMADKTANIAGFAPSMDNDTVRNQYDKFSTTISHDGGPIIIGLNKHYKSEQGELIINLTRINSQQLGVITKEDFSIMSDACSFGKPDWLAIVSTGIQTFAVFKLVEKQYINLLSFGSTIVPGQCFALPIVNTNTMLDCSDSIMAYDDSIRDIVLRKIHDNTYDLYKGHATSLDMMANILKTGLLCPWQPS